MHLTVALELNTTKFPFFPIRNLTLSMANALMGPQWGGGDSVGQMHLVHWGHKYPRVIQESNYISTWSWRGIDCCKVPVNILPCQKNGDSSSEPVKQTPFPQLLLCLPVCTINEMAGAGTDGTHLNLPIRGFPSPLAPLCTVHQLH